MVAPTRVREHQLEQVRELLHRLDAGRGGAALILGEAGLGKTRTLDQIAAAAVRKSARVVRINADELDSLAPLSTLIRGLTDPSNKLDAELHITAPGHTSGMWLVRDIQSSFERMSAQQPMVVLIDDVDRADEMTVHALRLLVNDLDTSPIVWNLTARGESFDRLAELRSMLAANDGLIVTLAPLSEDESIDVVTKLLGRRPNQALADRSRSAGGNPFLLTELVNAYTSTDAGQSDAAARGPAGAAALPERVREAARARLASLDPLATQVLDVAAVVGRAFSVDDLVGPTGQTLPQVLTAIRRLQQLSVIVDSGDHFTFRHEILRESILDDMPADVCRALHREVATHLLRRGRPPADLAKHLLAGVGPDDMAMAEPLIEAAERLTTSAPSEARTLTDQALEVTEYDRVCWLGVASRAIPVLIAVSDPAAASALLESAVDRGLEPDREAAARAQLCDALWRAGRTTDAVKMLAPVLDRPELSSASALRVEVALARTRVLSGAPAEAAELLARVVADARELGEHETVNYALAARSMALRFVGEVEASIDVAREAVTYLSGREWGGVDPRIWLARSLMTADRLEEAETLCGRVLNTASGPAASRDLPLVSATVARLLMAQGRVADVLTEAESGIAAMEADGGRQLGAELFACAAIAAWFIEGPEQAALLIDQGSVFTATNDYGMNHLQMAKLIVGDFGDRAGDTSDLTALVAPLLQQLEYSYGQLVFDPMHAPELVRHLLSARMRSSAEQVAATAKQLAEQNRNLLSWRASADHAAGLVHQDPDQIRSAGTRFTQSGRMLASALARADALALLARRRQPETYDAVQQVADDLRQLGASAAAERVLRTGTAPSPGTAPGTGSGRLRRTPQQRPATGWEALTPAELRVVEIAAQGATNKEIAKELWLSPYTVDTHMRHSLAKLGLRSRVALARLAAERESGLSGSPGSGAGT